jgi:hypothetical protein
MASPAGQHLLDVGTPPANRITAQSAQHHGTMVAPSGDPAAVSNAAAVSAQRSAALPPNQVSAEHARALLARHARELHAGGQLAEPGGNR